MRQPNDHSFANTTNKHDNVDRYINVININVINLVDNNINDDHDSDSDLRLSVRNAQRELRD